MRTGQQWPVCLTFTNPITARMERTSEYDNCCHIRYTSRSVCNRCRDSLPIAQTQMPEKIPMKNVPFHTVPVRKTLLLRGLRHIKLTARKAMSEHGETVKIRDAEIVKVEK